MNIYWFIGNPRLAENSPVIADVTLLAYSVRTADLQIR